MVYLPIVSLIPCSFADSSSTKFQVCSSVYFVSLVTQGYFGLLSPFCLLQSDHCLLIFFHYWVVLSIELVLTGCF